MPVKVRCPECAKVLNAPDRARGKSLKCPDCQSRIKVPMEGAAKPKKRRPRPAPADPDNLLSGLDLRSAEDQRTKICPKCAKVVGDEHEECPYCGVNIDTGVLSAKQQRRRSNQGPDPDDYFKDVWGNSKTFVKKNKSLVIRTVVNWTIMLTLSLSCMHIAQWCWGREVTGMRDDADNLQVTFEADRTVIAGTPDNKGVFRGKKYSSPTELPSVFTLAHRSPVVIFWRVLSGVFALGFGGWGIFLATEIVTATMRGERVLKRVQGDFFGNITLGIRAYVWPWFVLMPLPLVVIIFIAVRAAMTNGALTQTDQILTGVGIGSVYVLSLLFLPAAVVHWSQKHTYPAWLLVRMFVALSKTIRASLTLTTVMVLTCFLLPIGAAAGIAVGWGPINNQFANMLMSIAGQIGLGKPSIAGGGFLDFAVIELPVFAMIVGLALLILFGIVAFPAVYMMRAIGLYGLYFRNELDLVPETVAGEPVGFGPRYLAYCVDSFVTGIVLSAIGALQAFVAQFSPLYSVILVFGQLGFLFMYYMTSETGQARATPGKWSLGLMVLTENNRPMDRSTGSRRTVFAFVTVLTLFAGFLLCLFDPEKRALHDKMSKTKVCWKGDDERT